MVYCWDIEVRRIASFKLPPGPKNPFCHWLIFFVAGLSLDAGKKSPTPVIGDFLGCFLKAKMRLL
jgi:hypothetical protein